MKQYCDASVASDPSLYSKAVVKTLAEAIRELLQLGPVMNALDLANYLKVDCWRVRAALHELIRADQIETIRPVRGENAAKAEESEDDVMRYYRWKYGEDAHFHGQRKLWQQNHVTPHRLRDAMEAMAL
ncbi:MAG: hypothetical protein V2A34_02075 [Lentisphaerota bacterium]